MRYCRKCGYGLKDTALFCNKCGTECSKRIRPEADIEDTIKQKTGDQACDVTHDISEKTVNVAEKIKADAQDAIDSVKTAAADTAKDISDFVEEISPQTEKANTDQPDMNKPDTDQPDADQPNTDQPDTKKPGKNSAKVGLLIAIIVAILAVILLVIFLVIKPGSGEPAKDKEPSASMETEANTQAIAEKEAPKETKASETAIETESVKETEETETETEAEIDIYAAFPFEGSWTDAGGRSGVQIVRTGDNYAVTYHGSGSAFDGVDETMSAGLWEGYLDYSDGTATRYQYSRSSEATESEDPATIVEYTNAKGSFRLIENQNEYVSDQETIFMKDGQQSGPFLVWYEEPMQRQSDFYWIWYSSDILLSEDDLMLFSQEELKLVRNEIYARHGRKFKDDTLNMYFSSMPWYHGTIAPEAFDESLLSEIEKANIKFIESKENLTTGAVVNDKAGVLSVDEISEITELIKSGDLRASGTDFFVIIDNGTKGITDNQYVQNYYNELVDRGSCDGNAIIIFINAKDMRVSINTYGNAGKVIGAAGRQELMNVFIECYKESGSFADAITETYYYSIDYWVEEEY